MKNNMYEFDNRAGVPIFYKDNGYNKSFQTRLYNLLEFMAHLKEKYGKGFLKYIANYFNRNGNKDNLEGSLEGDKAKKIYKTIIEQSFINDRVGQGP